MNKAAIKSFAIWARKKLIEDITYKAGLMGVTEKGINSPLSQSNREIQFFDIGGKEPYSITGNEIKQREKLVQEIQSKQEQSDYATAYKSVIEEVAYTWFNRLIAIRFMEVNEYLPSRIRVLSSESRTKAEPDIVTTPFEADIEYSDDEKQKIVAYKNDNELDKLFRMLFIKQCNELNNVLPQLFEATSDYTELLLNISFTDKEGIVYRLVNDIDEDDFNVSKEGQVEIIGWMYQYYNTEPKDETFALLKKNVKITKERIPAATQLFTPDWIVRYMVENSLGRLWVEGHPNEELKAGWKYYLEEAEQEEDVKKQLEVIRDEYSKLKPEDIKVIDPCMGSGHILVYTFEVLMQIYESYGYSQREAAKSIIENNIYGLDIDNRAYQLAYFAVMMKARQYNRRILDSGVRCNLYAIKESNNINRRHIQYFGSSLSPIERETAIDEINEIIDSMKDAKEYGSILEIKPFNRELLERFLKDYQPAEQMSFETVGIEQSQEELVEIIEIANCMVQKYEAVITNPPYMGASGMGPKLSEYTKKYYPISKGDLFAIFIEKCGQLVGKYGLYSMITQQSWMFLSRYEKLRNKLYDTDIVSILHLGAKAFEEIGGEVVQTVAVIMRKSFMENIVSVCDRLVEIDNANKKEVAFLAGEHRYFSKKIDFSKIPASPYAYWISHNVLTSFENEGLEKLAEIVSGMTTGNNEKYLRAWFELNLDSIAFNKHSISDVELSKTKWLPYNKGGEQRKWYGNNEYVVNWSESKNFNRAKTTMTHVYLQQCITWSDISGNSFAGRFCDYGFLFDVKGSCAFGELKDLYYLIAIFNSKLTPVYIEALNPTTTTQVGDLKRIPLIKSDQEKQDYIEKLVKDNINIAKKDWDSFEISWDYDKHPYLEYRNSEQKIANIARLWYEFTKIQSSKMRHNEEELNEILINTYNLENELSKQALNEETCVRISEINREIKSFISYAVGCILGRYSLDINGIAYAGGKWDNSKYNSFIPDKNNIIPITDEEYFEDDIVGLFISFVKITFGEQALEENLDFIAQALGNKGNSPREIIRNYFIKDFFKDHCKTYQKRPIYWLFDSGKQNGFKALIYMHRYDENTIGKLRVDYLHKMQRIYESEIARMQETINNSGNAREVAAAEKRKEKLLKQLKETREYDEKISHLAVARIGIDLDDGVKVNYEKVQKDTDGKKLEVLAKI